MNIPACSLLKTSGLTRLQGAGKGVIPDISMTGADSLQLSGDAELLKLVKKVLGRDLDVMKLNKVIDVEHSLPNPAYNGTVNIVNENIRMGSLDSEIKNIMKDIDNIMQSGKRTEADAIAYRGEAYSERSKQLAKILNLKSGDKYTDNTYRYITGNSQYADNFAGNRDVTVRFNYFLPKGSLCIGTCEESCALLPKETFSEILSVDKSNPKSIIVNAILRTP